MTPMARHGDARRPFHGFSRRVGADPPRHMPCYTTICGQLHSHVTSAFASTTKLWLKTPRPTLAVKLLKPR